MSKKVEQAMAFHDKGYNCAQAVACSFCEEFGIDQETMFRVSEGFGLGMGMMDMWSSDWNADGHRYGEQCWKPGWKKAE